MDSWPSLGLKKGQPTVEAMWVFSLFRPTKERPLKEARASFGHSRSERWFDQKILAGGMVSTTERREKRKVSIADMWLLEEDARYSTFEPSVVCLLGEWSLLLFLSLKWRGL